MLFSGRVLNRFSKDLSFMDELLPNTFADFNAVSHYVLSSQNLRSRLRLVFSKYSEILWNIFELAGIFWNKTEVFKMSNLNRFKWYCRTETIEK